MIRQTWEVLKKNPLIIVFYLVFCIVSVLLTLVFMPANPEETTDVGIALAYAGKMMLLALVVIIVSLFFYSGIGNMLAEAVISGKTKAVSFLYGIKHFVVRLLLAGLFFIVLFIGFAVIFGIIVALLSFIITLALAGGAAEAAGMLGLVSVGLVYIAMLFLVPLIILWYPAIFIDDTGPIKSLKNGARAGVKNYWKLMLALLVMFLPSFLYSLLSLGVLIQIPPAQALDTRAMILSPGYLIMAVISFILTVFISTLFFVIYNKKNKTLENSTEIEKKEQE